MQTVVLYTKESINVKVKKSRILPTAKIRLMYYKVFCDGIDVTQLYCKRTGQEFKDGMAISIIHKNQKEHLFVDEVKVRYINRSLVA